MSKFARREKTFSLPLGHVRLVPTEDGYSVLFLPNGYNAGTHAMIGEIKTRREGWGWSPWHQQTRLPDVNRIEEAAAAVVEAEVPQARADASQRRASRLTVGDIEKLEDGVRGDLAIVTSESARLHLGGLLVALEDLKGVVRDA